MSRSVLPYLHGPSEHKSPNEPDSGRQHTRQARIQTEDLNGLDILSFQSDDERWRRGLPMPSTTTSWTWRTDDVRWCWLWTKSEVRHVHESYWWENQSTTSYETQTIAQLTKPGARITSTRRTLFCRWQVHLKILLLGICDAMKLAERCSNNT
jgi:hypothetical protein